jgi:hypothetical protein
MKKRFPTRAAFSEWLALRRGGIVGMPCVPNRCPLAQYLLNAGFGAGFSEVSVTFKDVLWSNPGKRSRRQALPRWAAEFVRWVDRSGSMTISGEQALALLETVPRRTGHHLNIERQQK